MKGVIIGGGLGRTSSWRRVCSNVPNAASRSRLRRVGIDDRHLTRIRLIEHFGGRRPKHAHVFRFINARGWSRGIDPGDVETGVEYPRFREVWLPARKRYQRVEIERKLLGSEQVSEDGASFQPKAKALGDGKVGGRGQAGADAAFLDRLANGADARGGVIEFISREGFGKAAVALFDTPARENDCACSEAHRCGALDEEMLGCPFATLTKQDEGGSGNGFGHRSFVTHVAPFAKHK